MSEYGSSNVGQWYYWISAEDYSRIADYNSGSLVNLFFQFEGLPGYYAPHDAFLAEDYDTLLDEFPTVVLTETWFTRSTEPNVIWP